MGGVTEVGDGEVIQDSSNCEMLGLLQALDFR
jgi:hypothetical protein